MDLTTLRDRIRRKYTKTNASNYPDVDIDIDINIAYREVMLMLIEAEQYRNTSGDFFTFDLLSSIGLVPGDQGYNGEYPNPEEAVKILEVNINYGDGHVPAEIVDRSDLPASMFNDDGLYDKSKPKVFIFRDSYFIRPLNDTEDDIEGGIILVAHARPEPLVLGSDVPLFEETYHNLIALKVAVDYYTTYPEKYNSRVEQKMLDYERKIWNLYESRTVHTPRIQAKPEKF